MAGRGVSNGSSLRTVLIPTRIAPTRLRRLWASFLLCSQLIHLCLLSGFDQASLPSIDCAHFNVTHVLPVAANFINGALRTLRFGLALPYFNFDTRLSKLPDAFAVGVF